MKLCLRIPTFAVLMTVTCTDWVELPVLSPTVAPSTTAMTQMFTSPSLTTISQIENSKQGIKTLESTPNKTQTNIKLDEGNSYENYISFTTNNDNPDELYNSFVKDQLKKVNDRLISEPHDTIGSKLKFLKQFERKLLNHIEAATKELWVDRQARGHKHKHMGFGVELPLLTIALLTFAVFLVKIVQQVILAMQANNASTDTVIVPQPIRKRHKRDLDNFATAMIFQYMEDFRIHHILNHEL